MSIQVEKYSPIALFCEKNLKTYTSPETQFQVHKMWENYKFSVMMNANKRVFQRMLDDDFPKPQIPRRALSVPDSDSECDSFTSVPNQYSTTATISAPVGNQSTAPGAAQLNEQIQRRELNNLEAKIQISLERKVKQLFQMISYFENSVRKDAQEQVSDYQFYQLQKMNRLMIISTFAGSAMFKHQHSDSIGMAILLISSIKMGLSKQLYLRNINKFCKKTQDKISPIRKSKPFLILKELIKSPDYKQF